MDGGLYVQYGCGSCAPDGWLNFDASPRLMLERVAGLRLLLKQSVGIVFPGNVRPGDIIRGLPVADRSAHAVYCSHVLEHVPRDDLPAALRNTHRILAPGGLFRFVVPDLQWRVTRYLAAVEAGDAGAADDLMESCRLGARARPKTPLARARERFGRNAHSWMYDFAALRVLLEHAGFVAVRRCDLGDSGDPMFALVEDESRFFEHGMRELAIEAARPGRERAPKVAVN